MRSVYTLIVLALVSASGHSADQESRTLGQSALYMVPSAVGLLCVSLVTAHVLAPETYSWKVNTISELASRGYRYAWLMCAGFIGFGVLVGGGRKPSRV